jgi:membrane protease YdiL (CAAX protease family)
VPGTVTRKALPAIAWLAVLPAADVGAIVYDTVWRAPEPGWMATANVVVIALLAGCAFSVPALRPLRGYLLALLAITAGALFLARLEDGAAWRDAFAHARPYYAALARAVAQILPCSLLALTLVGSGLTRRDVFVATGDLRAPSPVTWQGRRLRWSRLGPAIAALLAAGLFVQLTMTSSTGLELLPRALRALPLAMVFAAVNAAQEEFQFRAVLLARLRPAFGATHALFITSTLFGLAHWFGHPSGASGVLMAGVAGYVWGRSMIDTGGSAWAWIMHAVQDVVIFVFFVAAA